MAMVGVLFGLSAFVTVLCLAFGAQKRLRFSAEDAETIESRIAALRGKVEIACRVPDVTERTRGELGVMLRKLADLGAELRRANEARDAEETVRVRLFVMHLEERMDELGKASISADACR